MKRPPQNLKQNKIIDKKNVKALDNTQEVVSIIGDEKVPQAMAARYNEIAEIISRFCETHLNDDLKRLCLRAVAKLARKRPSPLLSGNANSWASGISYAIGYINFAYDKSQPYYVSRDEFAEWFGFSKNTITSQAAKIKKLLNLSYFNHEFTLKNFFSGIPFIFT
jgi:hypothetical protein